ncbi:MAG: hypothetical protein MH321_05090 [Leptospiraceae bacterium]|nr:hypothetical protein [Leptospiraceae bacterium]
MICYISACIFFLLETFLPDFSGLVVLGFLVPLSLISESKAYFPSDKIDLPLDCLFLFAAIGFTFFLPGLMPSEFLNTISLGLIAYLSFLISQKYRFNSSFIFAVYFFSLIILWLSSGKSISLSLLALFFILQMRVMLVLKIVMFVFLAFFSYLIFSFLPFSSKQDSILLNLNLVNFQILFMNYQFVLFFILTIYFLFRWIIFLKIDRQAPNALQFGIHFAFYLFCFLSQSWIFSVFLFFSSLPKQSQGKK